MDRNEWLALRRTGIGGSDAAAILGLNPYESPYSVWADKLGFLPERDDTEAMRQGRDLEEYVAQRFCEKSGKRVRKVNRTLRDPGRPFMLANIDRDIVKEASGLECKTTSSMNLKKFKGGDFPEQYYCQCVHYICVTGYTRWYLAVLVLNSGFFVYQMTTIENDSVPDWCEGSVYVSPEEKEALVNAEGVFWKLVEDKTPPPVDGSDATRRAIMHANPGQEEKPPVVLYGKESLIAEMNCKKEAKKILELEISAINNSLLASLEGSSTGIMRGYEVRMQTITKQPYTVFPKPYQQIRIVEVR